MKVDCSGSIPRLGVFYFNGSPVETLFEHSSKNTRVLAGLFVKRAFGISPLHPGNRDAPFC